jgi:hypothetical protein
MGAAASGVVVQDALPSGVTVQAVRGDSGFLCSAAGAAVTCTGGAIATGGRAQITIVVTLPDAAAAYMPTDSAVVNPARTLSERSYSNNSASQTTTVWFCPPTCII